MRFSVRSLFALTTAAALVVWLSLEFPYIAVPIVVVTVFLVVVTSVVGPIAVAVVAGLFWTSQWLTERAKRR